MGLLDIVLAPLRGILGSAEHEAEQAFPVQDLEQIQSRVLETADAIRDATEQIEAHVAVLETLATSIAPLTVSVEKMTTQLGVIAEVLAPLAAAEHDVGSAEHDVESVERDVSRIEHLLGRRHDAAKEASPPAGD
jgi:chromosome segregation ATPase